MTLAVVLVVAIAIAFAATIPFLARRARIHRAIVVAVALATTILGVLGTVPGLVIVIGAVVVAATGPSSGTPWGLLCALTYAGTLAGIATGAALVGRASGPRVSRVGLRIATTVIGAVLGTAVSFGVLSLAGSACPPQLLAAGALIVFASGVVGFLAPRAR